MSYSALSTPFTPERPICLSLIVHGQGNKQIAYQLGIAEHTVKNHVKNILSKLDVDDRTQAATAAIQRGIIHL